MSLRDRERLLRLRALRAERAASALAERRREVREGERRARLARASLETREGIEARIRDRSYRGMVGRPMRAAGLDAVDATLIALRADALRARDSVEAAEADLVRRRAAEAEAQAALVARLRAREVWQRLRDQARAQALGQRGLREDHAQEEACDLALLLKPGGRGP